MKNDIKSIGQKLNTFDRRRFLSFSAKALLGVGLGPMLQSNLASPLMAAMPGVRKAKAKNVIYLYMSGGMSQIDTFDTKPESENQGPVKSISTNVDGIQISQYLPNMAKHMNKVAMINSMFSNQGAHVQGNYYMHTNYVMRGTISHPSIGSWFNYASGKSNPSMPGNVRISGGSGGAGSGYLESKFGPLDIGDPDKGLQNSKLPNNINKERMIHRLTLLDKFNKNFTRQYKHKSVQAYGDMYTEALKLMDSQDLKAFDITQESSHVRSAYGLSSFGKGCLLARRLVEHDVRFVEVNLGSWDTHDDNFNRVESNAAILDQGMGALLADLERRGMLDETLVVLATEFGRTPTIVGARQGRNHFPQAFTCLLAGGGIQGGQRYGKTDKDGMEITENLVRVVDFNATIGHLLGLPLDEVITSPSGRPFTLGNKGSPIKALI